MASHYSVRWMCVTIMALALLLVTTVPLAEGAMTCEQVQSSLEPCISYLTAPPSGKPPAPCCAGVQKLKDDAPTTTDRRVACGCLKSAANSMKNLNQPSVQSLPKQCGVNLPYTVSPNINCDTIP